MACKSELTCDKIRIKESAERIYCDPWYNLSDPNDVAASALASPVEFTVTCNAVN